MDAQFLKPPPGTATIGAAHGDIAVAPTGEIFVSVKEGAYQGLQVYGADGRYLRNVPNAPNDLHGFIIVTASDGKPYIFGARLEAQQIVQFALDGNNVLTIPPTAIPDQYKTRDEKDSSKLTLSLTAVAVGPDGDIYAVDGYGRDFIHRFDKTGRYKGTFGGQGAPWNFDRCHKIAMDLRFKPMRLLCTDRNHNRLVQMDLDGNVLGIVAEGLRAPGAVATYGNELAVAESNGRVSILDLQGQIVTSVGTNDNPKEIRTDKTPPEAWQPDKFYAPHGIAYDAAGNLFVTEFSRWGRVVRLTRE